MAKKPSTPSAKTTAKTVRINGTDYPIPMMKFKQLKKAFPVIAKVQSSEDPMEMASAGIEVLSIAMIKEHSEMTPDWLEDNMEISETAAIGEFLADLMMTAGLISREEGAVLLAGEARGAAPSTVTSTPSSQNLSQPDAPGVTGT